MEEEVKQGEQQENSFSKTEKRYKKVMGQLIAVLGDPDWSKRPKIGGDALNDFLSRATEAKREKLYKDFEAGLNALVDEKGAYDKLVRQKEKEFNAAVEAEQKKFIIKAEALLSMVDDVKGVERRYLETLTSTPTPLGTGQSSSEEQQNS